MKILVFACNWCSYAGADYAGVSRLQYPANVRLIRTMCSGRVDEKFIWDGFRRARRWCWSAAAISATATTSTPTTGPKSASPGSTRKWSKMGIRPERLQLEWISAAEGIRFARKMEEMETIRRTVTSEEIEETIELLQKI